MPTLPIKQSPILYFSSGPEGENTFHLSALRYAADSDEWEANNIELKAYWFGTEESTFNVLSNVLRQAGIVLIKE